MQLLSPAGNMEALIAAVQNGANAVYFGGQTFNARRGAGNFDDEQLKEAIDYCHQRGVKAYIALNILIHQHEMREALSFAEKVIKAGADAIIVQDIGLASLLSQCSDIPLHASTQMALHNVEGINIAKQFGIARVVLPREIPLVDIQNIKEACTIEVELFAHGALCVGFSGQCYFSSLTGGRSGNRGVCAQICRLPMELYKENELLKGGYMLSPKDLCTVQHLAELKQSGADCLKIEGRMKSSEYVGGVTKIYREALDALEANGNIADDALVKELAGLFNRGSFTKGYYFGERKIIFPQLPSNLGVLAGKVANGNRTNKAEIQLVKPLRLQDGIEFRENYRPIAGGLVEYIEKNRQRQTEANEGERVFINTKQSLPVGTALYKISDTELMKKYQPATKEQRLLSVNSVLELKDNNAELTYSLDENSDIKASAGLEGCVEYDKTPSSEQDISSALSKLGGTIFQLKEINIKRECTERISAKNLNFLRRSTAEQLEKIVLKANTPQWRYTEPILNVLTKKVQGKAAITVETDTIEKIDKAFSGGADRVYYRPAEYSDASFEKLNIQNKNLYLALPNIAFNEDMQQLRSLLKAYGRHFKGILAGSFAGAALAQEFDLPCIADFTFNIMNCFTAQAICGIKGIEGMTMSVELNTQQLSDITPYFNCELMAYGRLPLMFLVHCPVYNALCENTKNPCGNCGGPYHYKDRRSIEFPLKKVKIKHCYFTVYNSKILSLYGQEFLHSLSPAAIRLVPEGDIRECIAAFRGRTPMQLELFTGEDTTKGHYQRGVE